MLKLALTISSISIIAAMQQLYGAKQLANQSPFIPASIKAKTLSSSPERAPNSHGGRFSLSGILKVGDHYSFSIYDSLTKQSKWLIGGDTSNDFVIVSFDEDSKKIIYSWKNQEGSITLTAADETPLPLLIESSAKQAVTYLATASKTPPSARMPKKVIRFKKSNISKLHNRNDNSSTRSIISENYTNDLFSPAADYVLPIIPGNAQKGTSTKVIKHINRAPAHRD